MEAEIVAHRDSLAQAQREAEERTNAQAAMEAEIVVLRDRLGQAQRDAEERTNAQAAMQGEIVGLRGSLAQARREAMERATGTAALRTEIDSLQVALEAARQVGKVAIAALKISGEPLPRPDPQPRRWRQVLRQIFGAEKHHARGPGDLVLQSDRG
jgi:chromosome segregation ATPase